MVWKGPVFNVTRDKYDAVLFDLDGVLTKTARVHAAAWKTLFDEYLQRCASQNGDHFEPFDVEADYRAHVDGKPRYEGVRGFLESRGIFLPYGRSDDPPDAETICGLGNRKNEHFNEQLKEHGVETYGAAVAFVRLLNSRGFSTAVVSSSKNCSVVLAAAGMDDLFDVRVDGVVAEELGLKGKPDPDIFLEAVGRLGAVPGRTIVLEDALSGVQAGSRGKFGCVIGVDRGGRARALRTNGADLVVTDLRQLTVEGEKPLVACPMDELPSALGAMGEIRRQLETRRLLVALDYDGTLTPIVERPDLAVLSEGMRQTVAGLAGACTVAVISGRDLADVRGLVGLDGLYYAGSHGFDIAGPEGRSIASQKGSDFLPLLDAAERSLASLLGDIEGVLIERKKFSIAVHYRQVAENKVLQVESAVDHVLDVHAGLRKSLGKKVFEVQPGIDWNKGRALLWLMEALEMDGPDVLPVYLGDDVTDEDAFRVLQPHGIGVVVREMGEGAPRFSTARYMLDDCRQVEQFLEELTAALRGGSR